MLLSYNPAVLKIIDFGTAALLLPECPKRRSAVGTPWYCAPEVQKVCHSQSEKQKKKKKKKKKKNFQ
jgi:serine/threonine protein kinase